MMNKNDQQFMAQKIRTQYMEKEASELDALRELDAKVKRPANVFAGAAWLSALFMILGSLIMIPAYPIYRRIARKTKAELTPEILRLSEEIMNSQKN